MAFSLSFGGDFFDSLYSAIEELATDPLTWEAVASYFDIEPEFLAVSTVYDKALELDACDDLTTPVSVWIVEGGWITADVPDTRDGDEFAMYC